MNRVIGKFLVATVATTMTIAAAGVATIANADNKSIGIWINGDKGYTGLDKVGQKFTTATGVKVTVEHPQDAPSKFQQAAAAGKGPDVFCWAHDRFGEWKAGGLIAEIKPSKKIKAAIEKKGWDAFTTGGKIYGYPYAFEAVGLIYNKDLVKTPPRSFEEIFALHKELQKDSKSAIGWDYNNTYFTFGLLAANNGYAFKRNADGSYDAKDVGVNNAGALKGLEMLLKLISEGVMPRGATAQDVESGITKGTLAMMISGPWMWANLDKYKINFGVAPLPTIAGKPGRPFVGVQGCMINQASQNKDLAVEFIENYMLTPAGLKEINDDKAIGVPAHKAFYKQLSSNPLIRATMTNVKNGVLMPALPEMGSFWAAMESALKNATQGRQSAREALDSAANRIKSK